MVFYQEIGYGSEGFTTQRLQAFLENASVLENIFEEMPELQSQRAMDQIHRPFPGRGSLFFVLRYKVPGHFNHFLHSVFRKVSFLEFCQHIRQFIFHFQEEMLFKFLHPVNRNLP